VITFDLLEKGATFWFAKPKRHKAASKRGETITGSTKKTRFGKDIFTIRLANGW
jgi:hypothetical protein